MSLTLRIRRHIRALPERVFQAWTQPEQLRQWWGPADVTCESVEIDLKVGGQYRIANRMPDGGLVWIFGSFEAIEAPRRLVFSWFIDSEPSEAGRVVVTFTPDGGGTEVTVSHERIASAEIRDDHERGWRGCLDGLAAFV